MNYIARTFLGSKDELALRSDFPAVEGYTPIAGALFQLHAKRQLTIKAGRGARVRGTGGGA